MSDWQRPAAADVWRAITTYLGLAYDGPPDDAGIPARAPSAVRARLATLRSTPDDAFYASPVFEREPKEHPTRFALRLGNRLYPHMKLVIDRTPSGTGHLLRADTHDAHIRPAPGSPEAAAFADLVNSNRALSESIESAWEREGLPTFKQFLRDDLARRRATK